jgi:hypothetical protein
MFEYMQYLMNGLKKIGGDDIEMPKRSRQDSGLFCTFISFSPIVKSTELVSGKPESFAFGACLIGMAPHRSIHVIFIFNLNFSIIF